MAGYPQSSQSDRKPFRPLPEHARALQLALCEPTEAREVMPSGSILILGIAPFNTRGVARQWYEWAREDWRAAAAFRRVLDRAVAGLLPNRHDLHKRAVAALAGLEREIKDMSVGDKRPPSKDGSATLAMCACVGELPSPDPRRYGPRKTHGQVRDGGHGVPRQASGGQADAKRGAQVGPGVRRRERAEQAATPSGLGGGSQRA